MLRSKSVGESIDLKFKCENKDCEESLETSVDVGQIKVPTFDEDSKTIELTDEVGVSLKFPSLVEIQALDDSLGEIDKLMSLMVSCVVSIYDRDNVYDAREETVKSITDFIESLNSTQFKKITEFFGNLPTLKHNVVLDCKCGHSNDIELEGLQSFFT